MYSVNLINCNNGFILLKSVTKIKEYGTIFFSDNKLFFKFVANIR